MMEFDGGKNGFKVNRLSRTATIVFPVDASILKPVWEADVETDWISLHDLQTCAPVQKLKCTEKLERMQRGSIFRARERPRNWRDSHKSSKNPLRKILWITVTVVRKCVLSENHPYFSVPNLWFHQMTLLVSSFVLFWPQRFNVWAITSKWVIFQCSACSSESETLS